jgi:hypothetical protein
MLEDLSFRGLNVQLFRGLSKRKCGVGFALMLRRKMLI